MISFCPALSKVFYGGLGESSGPVWQSIQSSDYTLLKHYICSKHFDFRKWIRTGSQCLIHVTW